MTEPNSSDSLTLDHVVDRFVAADHRLLLSDFDGTLAEIVDQPDDASIHSDSQTALADLAAHDATDVAVVSGRALEDVAGRVGLDALWYAGNHGLEIRIDGESFVHPAAKDQRGAIDAACDHIRDQLAGVDGAIVERKGLTATIHYRRVDDAAVDHVREAVDSATAAVEGIDVHDGKQVFELRPAIEWDKGRAVEWILDRAYDDAAGVCPLYLGDDVSDESAFEALPARGMGIRVGSGVTTAADVTVAGPSAVTTFLERLCASHDGS